ncbi:MULTISPECIES: 16S rRNA (adenine(1518)-N(6)/adenine(1519)-N(6))-dimethyltransferase RsmA [Roseibium]|uniref:16S rRNA (adenine(1518)-N(6)/adenine(1519)-N(6))- dimethyltransferase RsmA n=1 Tax=Roseibium TaxID=150830 RepID=UPI00094ACBC5|nr:16S rRNA (adenine(1518)-N(6)/adenine(1519)-N(6))-dimethyltransferase RsmA [Roseibium aggregatum]UES51490.1 16S rRNA (adenine(1518)-N(6)/adenine(1519)-N(6))-dimethyltransferase RsmA [Roseibium aggregatum]UFI01291.1 16S rRNA (adenine(1518)-N(6)/adenine(1519)-N(6))-dimethyltransferase RsmA [Roseibium aggregatum]
MAQIDDLPPLRDVIAAHGLNAKKSLGQNFLLDLNLTSRIARSAGSLEDCTVLEVGPGPGGLTRALLAAGAKRVIAIEKDSRCLPALAEISAHYPGRLEVIEGDALEIDPVALTGGDKVRIAANLPYNVGTQLLINWITTPQWPPFWSSLTLMFQKEVGERISASPASKAYGRLAVLAGWRCKGGILFDISPKAFTPPPKVTSAVVHLTPNPSPLPCDLKALEKITAAAFGQRRKMLRASLKSLTPDAEDLVTKAGLKPTARAEEIDIAGFVELANTFRAARVV